MIPRRPSSLREVSGSGILELHHRSPGLRSEFQPIVAQDSSPSQRPTRPYSPKLSPRRTPLLPSSSRDTTPLSSPTSPTMKPAEPTICGLHLKYVSLVTLAVQNAALSIVMHYSRVSIPPSKAYSPATAVLLNELLKGGISFVVAVFRVFNASDTAGGSALGIWLALRRVCREIFSDDCWKLAIPALLYVVQNSLQFVAVSNLPVATFQVTYQMKILTTAAFSVALLRKKLTSTKWLALACLAIGVGIVQIQTSGGHIPQRQNATVGGAHGAPPLHLHIMSPLKGFGAVTAACFTSGLAGVYFEMVLKNSNADLWVRNTQLSLFSLIPAALPVFWESSQPHPPGVTVPSLLRNFGGWAWATVSIQVLGGLITALVIKYSDNIMKGFATSLSIVLSFLASVALFGFRITPSFVIGSTTVLAATWMYNQPPGKELTVISRPKDLNSYPITPVSPNAPILGQFSGQQDSSPGGSPRIVASALDIANEKSHSELGQTRNTAKYLSAPYGSPFSSRTPSPCPTPPHPPPCS